MKGELMRGMKLKLYPTKKQTLLIKQFIDTNRYVYNYGLALKKELYETDKSSISKYDIIKKITELKNTDEYKWLKETHSQTLQQSIINLDKAFSNFFRRVKSGQIPGYPRFKSKYDTNQTFMFPQGFKFNTVYSKIYLPKIGWIKCRGYRKDFLSDMKQCTINYNYSTDVCTVSIMGNNKNQVNPNTNYNTIGIDVGTNKFLTDSLGNKILPLDISKEIKQIKILQKSLDKLNKNSNNMLRTRSKISKLYEKISNKRLNFIHHITNDYRNYKVVYVEDLNIKSISKNTVGTLDKPNISSKQKSRLNNKILQQSWGIFFDILEYKLLERCSRLCKVNPMYTSQRCSKCGNVSKESRYKENYTCVKCNHTEDADVNAAKNIEYLGTKKMVIIPK
jgi:putative transposase